MSDKTHLLKLSLLLPVLAVVFVSGCIGGDGDSITFGSGVAIQGWQPDFTSLESWEPVKFYLKIQNQGESIAENVEATIMGIDPDEWEIRDSEHDFDTLAAPDRVTNTPGETKTHYYNGNAPGLPDGTSFTFEPIVRVSYDYKTIAQKPITIVDTEELRRLIQQGATLPSKETTYTAGPLSVEIRTGNYVKTQEDPELPLYIVVTNVLWESGGSVAGYDYPIRIEFDMPTGGGTIKDCNTDNDWVYLWQGKTAEISCTLQVDAAPENTQVERLISAEIYYRYQVDSRTSVTVTG